MPEKLVIDPELVKTKTSIHKRRLAETKFDFYREMLARDSNKIVLSPQASFAVTSIESFLGTYSAFKESVRRSDLVQTKNYVHKEPFLDCFSLYAAALEGNHILEQVTKEAADFPEKRPVDFKRGESLILEDIIGIYLRGTRASRNGDMLASYTRGFFDWLAKEALQEKKKPEYHDLESQAEQAHIRINSIVINGFNHRTNEKDAINIPAITRADYVGNEDFITKLSQIVTELFDYDFKEKKNPNVELGFPQTILVYGDGGCGKTLGITVALNEAKERADKLNVPFYIRELRGFKSEFYAKSTENLRKIFEEVKKGDAIYAVVAEDIDTIFFSREELKNRPEDKDLLGEIMNQLEGISSNTHGNSLLISTTNHPDALDGPFADRLRQCQLYVRGSETKEDYAKLLKVKLRKGVEQGFVEVKNWDSAGKLCVDYELANRDVRNIAVSLLEKTRHTERPEGFYSMNYAQRLNYLLESRTRIDDKMLENEINKYGAELKKQDHRAFEAKVSSIVEQRRLHDEAEKVYKNEH